MKLAVIGASGFLGRHLLLKAPESWDIIAVYRSDESFTRFLQNKKLTNVIPVKSNLHSSQSLDEVRALTGGEVDACVVVWGNSDIEKSIHDPSFDLQSNIVPLLHILSSLRISRLVFISSGTVYLGNSGVVTEQTPTTSKVPYGISKLTSELYIQCSADTKGNPLKYTIFRFFGAYGPYEPERKIYTKLVETFAIRGEHRYTLRGTGNNLIDAMYVEDAVGGILRAVTENTENAIINFAAGQPMSINDLVTKAAAIFGISNVDIHHVGATAEPISFLSSTEKMEKMFHFQSTVTIEAGLRQLHTHLVQEGAGR